MNRSPLIVWLAAVFAGLTVLLVAAGAATGSVFVLFVSLPLGITAGIMWLHGTGRLNPRMRARTARDRPGSGFRSGRADRQRTAGGGPFARGRGPFTSDGGRFAGRQRRAERRRTGRQATAGAGRRPGFAEEMSTREAAEVLGVEPGADDAAVKRAYREKAKRHHPDVEGGDEATFKRVTEAYERLT